MSEFARKIPGEEKPEAGGLREWFTRERNSSLEFLNPLRIPKSDAKAEQIINDLTNGVLPAIPQAVEKDKVQAEASAKTESADLNSSQATDTSIGGVIKTFGRLVKFSMQTSRGLTAASFGLGCVAAMQGLAAGQLVSWVQSSGAPTIVSAGLMVGAACAAIATICTTNWLGEQVNARFGWRLSIFLDRKFYQALLSQPFKKLDDEDFHRTLAEVKQHRFRLNGLLFGLSSGVAGGIGLAVSCAAYAQHNALLAGVTAAMILPRLAVDLFLAPSIDAREKEQARRLKKIESATRILSETNSVRELKMHHREQWALDRVEGLMDASRTGRFRILNDTAWRQLFGSAPLIVGGILSTATPIVGYFNNTFPAAALPSAVGAGIGLTTSAFMVAGLWGQILSQRIFIQRVLNFFDQTDGARPEDAPRSNRAAHADQERASRIAPTIEFRDVVVRVPLRKDPILTVPRLTLHPGEVVGIVGEKGQGKTTFLRLLMKQIEPSGGRIILHGFTDSEGALHEQIDLSDVDTREWHSVVSKLYQDYPQMEGLTVAEATHLGSRDDNDPGVLHAQSIVNIRDILPDGVNASQVRIGSKEDNGITFSGGQMQVTAVMRTLAFSEKPINFLDEPGAHADARSEHDMLARVKTASREAGKLTVIVSHRYGTLTDVDRIIVINNHTIEQIGTHRELMKSSNTYRSAWIIQTQTLMPGIKVDIDDDGRPVFTPEE